jgi:citramalate synthase
VQLLIRANTPAVTIFGKTWDLHVTEMLRTTLDENLRMIRESVRYLKSHGKEVIYDAEHFFDGYRANPEYALSTLKAAIIGGADSIVLCDTNGGGLPWQIGEAVDGVRTEILGQETPLTPRPARLAHIALGIHTHNDSETGVANALEAVRRGCTQVQGTVNGYGERCGNANLISIIPDLQLKMGYDCVPEENLRELVELSRYVSEMANLNPDTHQPFVGQSAFAHKGGTHVNAVVKYVMSYQHIDPALIGNETRVLVSELSGKDNIASKRKEFGLDGLTREEERYILQQIKELENAGFAFESAEASVDLMLRRARAGYQPPFEMIDYTTTVEHRAGRGHVLRSHCQGARRRAHFSRSGGRQRPGQRTQSRAAQGDHALLPAPARCASDGLQSAHPRQRQRHGGHDACPHRLQQRRPAVDDRRRFHQHHRSQLDRTLRLSGVFHSHRWRTQPSGNRNTGAGGGRRLTLANEDFQPVQQARCHRLVHCG